MSLPSVIDSNAAQHILDVAELASKGWKPMHISKELGIPFAAVKKAIEQWEEILRNDMESRDAARDYLNRMVSNYDDLLKVAHENLDNLKSHVFDEKISAQINATLKNIADFEAKRVDALQKAGLLDAHDLGDELAEREEREAQLINILRNDLCNDCKYVVAVKLQALTNQVEAVQVFDDEAVDSQ